MTDSTAFDPRALAAKLHELRQKAERVPTAEFVLPADVHQAMDAQNFLTAEEGIGTNAWKVTVMADGQPVTAPLSPYVEASSGATIPWFPGIKFEAEIAVRLNKHLPVRTTGTYSREEVVDAVSSIHLGAELCVSAVKEGGSISFLLFLADRIGNGGYVLGPELPKSLLDTLGDLPLKVTLGGETVYDGAAKHPKGDVLTWLIDYANDGLRPETSLKSGAVITTGTLCGAPELMNPGEITIQLGDVARLDLAVAAA